MTDFHHYSEFVQLLNKQSFSFHQAVALEVLLLGGGKSDLTAIPEKHRLGVLYHYCFAFCFILYKHRSLLYAKIVGIGNKYKRCKILKLYASFSLIITCLFSVVKASRHFYEPLYLYYHFQIFNYRDKS